MDLILATIARLMADSASFGALLTCAIAIQNYDPSHGRGSDLDMPGQEGNSLRNDTAVILPTCVLRLTKLCQAAARKTLEQNETLEKIIVRATQPRRRQKTFTDAVAKTRIASILDALHIPQLLADPPPQVFLGACLFFAFAIGALQHSHKADRYLNKIIVSGLAVGTAAAFQTTNVLMALKSYSAWSTILALLLSVFIHWAMRLWEGRQTLDDGSEMIIHLHDKSCHRKDSPVDVVQKGSPR